MEIQNCYNSVDIRIKDYIDNYSKNALLVTDFEQSNMLAKCWPSTSFVLWKDEVSDLRTTGFNKPGPNITFCETVDHAKIDRKNDFFDWIYDAYILTKCFKENKL